MYKPYFLTVTALAAGLPLTLSAQAPVDYKKQVQPIFDTNCKACHSGGAAPGGLLLDSGGGLMAGSESGKVIVPGNSKDSLLVQRIREKTMPPNGAGFGNGFFSAAQLETTP